jgi:hypothetical protein
MAEYHYERLTRRKFSRSLEVFFKVVNSEFFYGEVIFTGDPGIEVCYQVERILGSPDLRDFVTHQL